MYANVTETLYGHEKTIVREFTLTTDAELKSRVAVWVQMGFEVVTDEQWGAKRIIKLYLFCIGQVQIVAVSL